DPAVQIVPCAVAATSEPVTLHMSSRYPTITTAAGPDWQSTVRQAVSYPIEWDETIEVCSVTLDQLIAEHGIPGFCKIDVEGLEAEVFRGLTHPLPALSFEFFRETESVTRACVHRLEELGQYRYNWSKGETQRLELDLWLSAPALMRVLGQLPAAHLSGDIYAVLV
ncbi:MAG: FkbM family methyltransferase, partial [Saprospiraceae bacterium]|nr:FkbM family methyltransferase [Saprospiraceae bacterium]